jgi:hypothetical protein
LRPAQSWFSRFRPAPSVLLVPLALALCMLALGMLMPARARAETAITTQAVADHGAFLPYAPPPSQPAGLCLVDTGVNLNPDTESTVVDRTAIDGGSGDDLSPTTHGTIMAMIAAAPANGWGMVGTAPAATRIVSVRILEPGQSTFPFSAYAAGITMCLQLRQEYHIRVINLSLGASEEPSSESYERVGNAVQEAGHYGVAVVAAAGNDDGGPVEYPAAYPSVLSVGASDTQAGGWCAFSNRGEGLRLLAPGCGLDAADPATGAKEENYWQGTSEASAIAAAALDALIAYRPELTAQEAEQDLTAAAGGALNIAQAFNNAGLSQVVAAGEAAEPKPATTTQGQSTNPKAAKLPQRLAASSTSTMLTARFPKPRARLTRAGRRYVLRLQGRPGEAQAQVRLLGHHRRSRRLSVLRTLTGSFNRLTLPASGVLELRVCYVDPFDVQRDSAWTMLRLPGGRHRLDRGRSR